MLQVVDGKNQDQNKGSPSKDPRFVGIPIESVKTQRPEVLPVFISYTITIPPKCFARSTVPEAQMGGCRTSHAHVVAAFFATDDMGKKKDEMLVVFKPDAGYHLMCSNTSTLAC